MKPWLEKLKRAKPEIIDRSNYLRLDKNERVIDFDKKFLNYLKKIFFITYNSYVFSEFFWYKII
tara:strand:- start:52 stop:243 length:192 start_codon:yes stop_codon:yes gene_type:complete